MGLLSRLFGSGNNSGSPTPGNSADLLERLHPPADLDGAMPGPVLAFTDDAFGVCVGELEELLVTWIGGSQTPAGGSLLAVGHDGLFVPSRLANPEANAFVRDLVVWMVGGSVGKATGEVSVIGPKSDRVVSALRSWGVQGVERQAVHPDAAATIVHGDALDANAGLVDQLTNALNTGRSVWVHSTPWGWADLTDGDLRTDHGGNALVQQFGLSFCPETVDLIEAQPSRKVLTNIHAGRARERLLAGKANNDDASLLTTLLGGLHPSNPFRSSLAQSQSSSAQSGDPAAFAITPQRPVLQSDHSRRIGARLWLDTAHAAPAVVHHETAPEIEIVVPAGTWGWVSTGREARPGEEIRVVERNSDGTDHAHNQNHGQTWQVRIGAQTDELWHLPSWSRFPAITTCATAQNSMCTSKNPFGGIAYIDVSKPSKTARRFVVSGGVVAHRYVLNDSAASADWLRPLERNGYAEIEGKRFVLTVPSDSIADLHDPTGMCNYFDTMLDTCADLAGIDPVRGRKERYVCDVQIAYGYLHAGYPMMGHLDMAPVWTSEKRLRAYDQNASWAMFHETGHNHQDNAWTPDGTVEVTCNLFSLYCAQKLHGLTETAHNELGRARAQAVDYKRRGAPFAVWKDEPFLALQTYRELIDTYGWDTLKAVIASYSDASFGPRPTTDAERYDAWAVRYSSVTKRDLSGHFTGWGIPLSKSAVAACGRAARA
jgi:hypothetical protein